MAIEKSHAKDVESSFIIKIAQVKKSKAEVAQLQGLQVEVEKEQVLI